MVTVRFIVLIFIDALIAKIFIST